MAKSAGYYSPWHDKLIKKNSELTVALAMCPVIRVSILKGLIIGVNKTIVFFL